MEDHEIRDFRSRIPLLSQKMAGKPLVYLDNAASAPTPENVIEAVSDYYRRYSCNIHRGLYELSSKATDRYEQTRRRIADFIGAAPEEIIYTRGTTEAVNLIAGTWGREQLGPGDAVVITELEHHANLVPWQELTARTGAELRYIPVDAVTGDIQCGEIEHIIDEKVALVAVSAMSNVTGVTPPLQNLRRAARTAGALFVVDAAQLAAHRPVDVTDLDPDFLVFSLHKLYGPTGIGVLYGRRTILEKLPPFLTGGDMITRVRKESSDYREPPQRFEAGTPHIAGVFGAEAALDFLEEVELERIARHEERLMHYALEHIDALTGVKLYGPHDPEQGAICSFNVEGVHPHDTATILAEQGIAVRAGFHCAQPYVERLGAPGTVRASLAFFNTPEDIDMLVEGLGEVKKIFTP